MTRKVDALWAEASRNGRPLAIAIAKLQRAGEDTGAVSIAARLGETHDYRVAARMACLKKVTDEIDSSPDEPPMLEFWKGSDGRVRYRFAPEACDALLRRRDGTS